MTPRLKGKLTQGTGGAGTKADEARKTKLSFTPKDLHDHLYDCLSILDGKAAALLQFDAILVATSAIVLTLQKAPSAGVTVMVGAALLFAALSSVMTLSVVYVFWTEAHELESDIMYAKHLREVLDSRTFRYRLAWCLSCLSLGVLAIGAALNVL